MLTTAMMLGQLLMVGFVGKTPTDEGVRHMGDLIRRGLVGNVILFRRNIESSEQLKPLTAYLHDCARSHSLPLIIAVDQEGGKVQRLRPEEGFPQFPTSKTVGTYETAQIQETYTTMANLLGDHGINMNLGPVIDLDLESTTGVIGRLERAYSADPDRVARAASFFVDAHRTRKIWTCVKHPPGHGSAKGDTHEGWTDVSEVWQDKELNPLRTMLQTGHVDSLMMAHTFNRQFDTTYPASLSPSTVDGLLRQQLRFKGVVITDDLHMKAISLRYGIKEAAERALEATGDMLILSHMQHPTLTEHVEALVDSEVESLHRVLAENRDLEPSLRASFERVKAMKEWEAI